MNKNAIKILAVGDVVGECGTAYIKENLWRIRRDHNIDMTVLNGENAAVSNGIDPETAETLFASGADVITSGNHIWQKKSVYGYIENTPNLLRPVNYPPSCPGSGYTVFDCNGYKVLCISVLGTVYLDSLESPFVAVERVLERENGEFDFAVCDIHAEATSEKIAFGYNFDGRISAIFGTHTHVQTADNHILPGGTGYITDLGMTGPSLSVIGMKTENVLTRFVSKMPARYEEGEGNPMFNACIFSVETASGNFRTVETQRLYF